MKKGLLTRITSTTGPSLWRLAQGIWLTVAMTVNAFAAVINFIWGFAAWIGVGIYLVVLGFFPAAQLLGLQAPVLPEWPDWAYRWVAPLTILCFGLLVTSIRMGIRLRRTAPRLELGFEPAADGYVQTAPVGNLGNTVLYRVSVTNTSQSRTVRNVSVILEKHAPQGSPFLPVPLHLTHDNPPVGGTMKESLDLRPKETRLFDVVEKWPNGTTMQIPGGAQSPLPSNHIRIYYGVAGVPQFLPDRRYVLHLRVAGDDVQPVVSRFVAEVDARRNLTFRRE